MDNDSWATRTSTPGLIPSALGVSDLEEVVEIKNHPFQFGKLPMKPHILLPLYP
jgi:hypothetical protein